MGLKVERFARSSRLQLIPQQDAGAMHKYAPGSIADDRARQVHTAALELQRRAVRLAPEHRRTERRRRRGRRTRRIFLLLVLLATAVAAAWLLLPSRTLEALQI
ncbi:MAG: hypothetical protein ACRDWY_17130 [Actinomycetes bacterium]